MNEVKEEMARLTNPKRKQGKLADLVVGADVFIGVSAPGVLTTEMVGPWRRIQSCLPAPTPTGDFPR